MAWLDNFNSDEVLNEYLFLHAVIKEQDSYAAKWQGVGFATPLLTVKPPVLAYMIIIT